MAEKSFYGSNGQFKGSMDDDGRIYDERHGFIGYVKDGRIYDNCNIPHGRITDNGMVVDNYMQEVGQEYGTGFSSRGTRREMGRVRADILSDGHGSDYGAFHLLDRDQRHKYDSYPYDDDDDGEDDYDDDCESEESFNDDYDDSFDSRPSRSRHRHSSDGGGGSESSDEYNAIGCGCTILILIGIYIAFRMVS